MIKVKDLRQGNIINKKFVDSGIFEWSFYRAEEHKELIEFPHIFEPTVLTDEWLYKFGFRKEAGRDGYYWELSSFRLGEAGKYFIQFGIDTYRSVEVIEVHHLQNLFFALTGEELEIKL